MVVTTTGPYQFPSALNTAPLSDMSMNPSPFADASGCYQGMLYAFLGEGGFFMEEGLEDVKFRYEVMLQPYDTTNAVHIKFCASVLNAQLGLVKSKDANGHFNITSSYYNDLSDCFVAGGVAGGAELDTVTIAVSDFMTATSDPDNIICVGAYSTLYSDFITYVDKYFGFSGGFASLFSGETDYDISGQLNAGVFDVSQLWHLIHDSAYSNANGSYKTDLSGSVTVSNITLLLRNAVDANVFNNRDPSNGTTAIDPSNRANYGVEDGFMAGDVIFCPSGTQITLNLNIDSEVYNPLNNIGPNNASTLPGSTPVSNFTTTQTLISTNFVEVTTANLNNIKKVAQAPLAIHVVDC